MVKQQTDSIVEHSVNSGSGLNLLCLEDLNRPLEQPTSLQRFGYAVTNPGKNFLIPASWLRSLLRKSRSPLLAETFLSPGGWRSMEYVYQNARPLDWLDRQALRDNPISMAARNRRKLIIPLLSNLIQQFEHVETIGLLGIGAGPGRHLQQAIVDSGINRDRVAALLVDLADDAFEYGQALSRELDVSSCVRFLQADARDISSHLPDQPIHIAKLVGIIEYLTDEQLGGLLDALHRVMAPSGQLVTHGLVDRYRTGPFLRRVFDLKHHQRDHRKVSQLLEQSGFSVLTCDYEPAGIHPIIVARKI